MAQRDWILGGALAVALLPGLDLLSGVWSTLDYYSHGYLVPLFSLWLAHGRRRRLPAPGHHGVGLVALLLALALYAAGLLLQDPTTTGLGIVGAVASAVTLRLGVPGLRRLAFPLGFLLFMVPIPPSWLNPVIVGLQFVVSAAAVSLVQLAGIDVFRQGNRIELAGGGSLFVAEACSGITSLVTLLPLGCLLAYFTEKDLGRRLWIVAAVVPIAMFGNLVRVVGTVAAADVWGVDRATSGALHDSAGLLTFILACVLLLAFGQWIRSGRDAAPA